jgi:hypothetical protein
MTHLLYLLRNTLGQVFIPARHLCRSGGVHEEVRGQFRGHGAEAQRPLDLFDGPNGPWFLSRSPRNQRDELVIGLASVRSTT